MTKIQAIAKAYRYFMLVIVSLGIGMVSAVTLFVAFAFLVAGPDGGRWFPWFFGGDGYKFFVATLLLGGIAFPFVKRANLKLV